MKKKNSLAILIAIISSICGCHAPQATTKTIITVHHDTLFSKEIHKDTIINNIFSKDTVVIHDNKLTVKYVYKGGDSAYIGGTVQRDTVIKVDSVKSKVTTVIKEVPKPKDAFDWLEFWVTIIAGLFLAGKFGIPALAKIFKP